MTCLVFLCLLSPVIVWRDLGVCVIVNDLSNSFSIDGRNSMVTSFPHVEMLQYLFDDMWLFDESDDYHFALAFGAY